VTEVTTRKAIDDDLFDVVALAALSQSQRVTHAGFCPSDPAEIRSLLSAASGWPDHTWVAERNAKVVAWVMGVQAGSHVDWMGPFAEETNWEEHAGPVLEAAREATNASTELVHADNRNYHLTQLSEELGFTGSTGLVEIELASPLKDSIVMVHPMIDEYREFVSMFHEETFPDSEVVGSAIVDATGADTTLVVRHFDAPVGYINTTRESEVIGRINFLAVMDDVRRKRLGGELVRAAVAALVTDGALKIRALVGDDNKAARELFQSLGFTEQRLVVPFRR
jgi:ribosomal protein S18 acetylase RimI-like enzyme